MAGWKALIIKACCSDRKIGIRSLSLSAPVQKGGNQRSMIRTTFELLSTRRLGRSCLAVASPKVPEPATVGLGAWVALCIGVVEGLAMTRLRFMAGASPARQP